MATAEGLRLKRFNLIETAGSILLGASIITLFLTLIGFAPLKFGALFLSIGVIVSIYLFDTEKIEEGGLYESIAMISLILTLFGTIGVIMGIGESFGIVEQLASEQELHQGRTNGIFMSLSGIVVGSFLFGLGELLKIDE